jgi:hypothetical protein
MRFYFNISIFITLLEPLGIEIGPSFLAVLYDSSARRAHLFFWFFSNQNKTNDVK